MADALDAKQLWLLEGLIAEGVQAGAAPDYDIRPKEAAFLDCYLQHLNGTRAAVEAGYSPKNARYTARDILAKAHVRRELRRRLEGRRNAAQLSVDGILDQLRKLSQSDPRTLFHPDGTVKRPADWPDDIAARVAGFEVEEREFRVKGERAEALRAKLAAAGVTLDELAEIVVTRVVKLKLWDPNRATEVLARYRKLLVADEAPAPPVLLQIPAAMFQRQVAAGADARSVPAIVDGRAEPLDENEGTS